MKKAVKKVIAVASAIAVLGGMGSVLMACNEDDNSGVGQYTLKDYTSELCSNWNPHTWQDNSADSVLAYTTSPFVDMSIKNTATQEYQWVYEMATSITDVTADHQSDLTKYGSTFSGDVADVDEGYVFEIKLNPDAKWENGVEINADDYVYSMQQLLNSKMRNYRSNLYWAGESEIAGAREYYNSEAPIYNPVVPAYGDDEEPDYSFDTTSKDVFINLTSGDMTFSSYSFGDLTGMGYISPNLNNKLAQQANPYGFIKVTDDNKADVLEIMDQYLAAFKLSIWTDDDHTAFDEELFKEFLFYNTGTFGEEVSYDKVGMYKVDDYTIRYVTKRYQELDYFLTSCTSTWLVYEPLYEAGKDTTGELVTTNYGTSKETYMSYGVYKIDSMQKSKQMVFSHNTNWYGFKEEDGKLVSYTNFLVDGEKKRQYQVNRIVLDVMQPDTAKELFLKGQLSAWSPNAEEASTYATSDKMYKADETFSMSFFFHTDLNNLKTMDTSKGNTNSVVLSNTNFRKAMSLAINRADFVSATAGWKPTYSLMNNLYYYDAFSNPNSQYRATEPAMQAICNLYGVEYGADKTYKTLKEAYESITGYNLTEAKALMKTACDELVAAGLYTKGADIKIKVGWAKGALTSDDNKQCTLINQYLNAALEGSGFGKITLEAVGNIDDRYADTASGEYAIGYGAWGGAAFYPFRNFTVYMDPVDTAIHEAGCWDPTTTNITLTVNGQEYTQTAQAWSHAITEGAYKNADGKTIICTHSFVDADFDTKLSITAQLEEWYLKQYYRIPLASTTAASLLSYQFSYYTDEYQIMYGYGGTRLIQCHYDDAEWAKYVKDHNGQLSYV